MSRFGVDNENIGTLRVDASSEDGSLRAYFVPNLMPEKRSVAYQRGDDSLLLAELNQEREVLKIHPINTWSDNILYLHPKYDRVHTLTFYVSSLAVPEGTSDFEFLFSELPSGFVKNFRYGMGLRKQLNRLIKVIEENTQCNELIFDEGDLISVDGSRFVIGLAIFDEIWSEVKRIDHRGTRAASRVKDAFVHNVVAESLGLARKEYSLGRHQHSLLIAKAADGIEELSDSEQDILVDTVMTQSCKIVERDPNKLYQLRHDIELVTLDHLISEYEEALGERKKEAWWQKFFECNKFALQQIFGAPFVYVASQAPLGTRNLSGNGETIVDYLLKDALTNSVAIVEIKTPSTDLLQKGTYRRGIFAPSADLSGAVTQVLDQAYELAKRIAQIKEDSDDWNLESYAVRCFVIAGRTPSKENCNQLKSLEIYRYNSRNATIVTYDDILERMKILRTFLSSDAPNSEV